MGQSVDVPVAANA